jgi:two-component system CheB/CheR fusion protein
MPSAHDAAITPTRAANRTATLPTTRGRKPSRSAGLVVVGIGASAGGLEALVEFFAHVPVDTGLAFVVVTHQQLGHLSLLPEILGRRCRIPVAAAVGGARLQRDRVYVGPSGAYVTVRHGRLQLTEMAEPALGDLPIDRFLRTLAQDRRERAVCVILSGTGADGSLGLIAVKGEGGMAMVQAVATAKYAGMPSNAIATGVVDYILPPAEMPAQLVAYVHGPYLHRGPATPAAPDFPARELQEIMGLIRARTRYDFSPYKTATIQRRIERRMNVQRIRDPAAYIRLLQEDPAEVDRLFKDLLISVTSFFRDRPAWERLNTKVLPELLGALPDNTTFRVWVPGCATGEEVYSVAILLRECTARLRRRIDVQIFGTDLDLRAIEIARAGIYPEGIAADVPAEWLERYFTRQGHHYTINKDIRSLAIFAEQNAIGDPPFGKLDWISCRNLLIYLNADAQRRLFRLFHYALNPGGLLSLGPAESIDVRSDFFRVLDRTWKFFLRHGTARPRDLLQLPPSSAAATRRRPGRVPAPAVEKEKISQLVERVLLNRYTPASILVDQGGDILYVHGRTGLYLEPATGGASRLNILEMAREGLATELRTAMRLAHSSNREIVCENLRVKGNRANTHLSLAVVRLEEPEPLRGLLLVVLRPASGQKQDRKGRVRTGRAPMTGALLEAKKSLQATVEALASANAELSSANTELQSANEEMQSSNEELDTSREELQSLNEELSTVNAEQSVAVDEAARARDDMQNLLNSIEVATIFLDNDLRVRRYTEAATKLVHLIPSDVGRPLLDQASELRAPHLVDDCRAVLTTLQPRQAEVETKAGAWLLMRILPYRTTENAIDGVVLTFVNISEVTLAEKIGREARAYFESIFNTVQEPLLVLDERLGLVSANKAALAMFCWRPRQVEGESIYEVGRGEWNQPELRHLLENLLPRERTIEGFRFESDFPLIGRRTFLLNATRLERPAGMPAMILLALRETKRLT